MWALMRNHARSSLWTVAALLAGVPLLGSGCFQRVLEVRSDPPGAAAYVNGEAVGVTPCDHPFFFYGTVDVTLRKAGYVSLRQLKTLSPPWYQFFPLDAVTDFLPLGLRDVHEVDARLEPAPRDVTAATRTDMEKKAEEMRALLAPSEDATPPPN
jgi:hypothetical protein